MDYKQISPDIVIRASDGVKLSPLDPEYLAWLEEGNNPFPPDPPVGAQLIEIIEELE